MESRRPALQFKFNTAGFLLIAMASLLPDVVGFLMDWAKNDPHLSYKVHTILAKIDKFPWKQVLFGLFFALACKISDQRNRNIRMNHVLTSAALTGFFWVVITLVVFVLAGLMRVPFNPMIIVMPLFAMAMTLSLDEALQIGSGGFLGCIIGIIGAVSVVLGQMPHPAFKIAAGLFYFVTGLILAFRFASPD